METFYKGKIGIIGSDPLAQSWAMVFASVGYKVTLYDKQQKNITETLSNIGEQLKKLNDDGVLRGKFGIDEQIQCIKGSTDLKNVCNNAILVLECMPEDIDDKIKIFINMDKLVDDETILASSNSILRPSLFSKDLKHRSQVIVAHSVNPPYYVALVEIVPSPWTKPDVVKKTRQIMVDIGQEPIILSREIDGFVVNRIQFAVLNEVWRLLEDNIVDVEDMEKVMSEGLGLRYAFAGALETSHLNAEGMKSNIERYGEVIYGVTKTMGAVPNMLKSSSTNMIVEKMNKIIPLERLQERRAWRDACLLRLSELKKEMNQSYKKL